MAQTSLSSKNYDYGITCNFGKHTFLTKQKDLIFNNQPIFAFGYFYIKKLSNNIVLGAELLFGKEYYSLNYENLKVKSHSTNIYIPLNVFYQLFQSRAYASIGANYQFTKLNDDDKSFEMSKNNVNANLGINYLLRIGNINIIPSIVYLRGLNNAVESLNTDFYPFTEYDFKKSSFVLSIKFM